MAQMKKVNAGDALNIPADTYNQFIDAANSVSKGNSAKSGGMSSSIIKHSLEPRILIANNTGGDLAAGSMVELKQTKYGPDSNPANFYNLAHSERMIYDIALPTGDNPEARLGRVDQGIPDGGVGTVQTSCIFWGFVQIVDPNHQYVTMKTQTQMVSSSAGTIKILERQQGSVARMCILELNPSALSQDVRGVLVYNPTTSQFNGGYAVTTTGFKTMPNLLGDPNARGNPVPTIDHVDNAAESSFGVCQGSILPGGFGRVVFSGITLAIIQVIDPLHKRCRIASNGSTAIVTDNHGTATLMAQAQAGWWLILLGDGGDTGIVNSPQTIGYQDDVTPTKNSSSWNAINPTTGKVGVEVWVVTHVAVNQTTHKVIQFMRKLTFNDTGRLTLVGPESMSTTAPTM